MAKEKKVICGPNCNQAKFYIVALVLVVGVVAIFSMYLGVSLTGNPILEKNVESYKSSGERCIKNEECESNSRINNKCTGGAKGAGCAANDDCAIGGCSRTEGICGGYKARCYSDAECINGCDENQRVCKGIKQINEECNDDVECIGNLRCRSNVNNFKVCTY